MYNTLLGTPAELEGLHFARAVGLSRNSRLRAYFLSCQIRTFLSWYIVAAVLRRIAARAVALNYAGGAMQGDFASLSTHPSWLGDDGASMR